MSIETAVLGANDYSDGPMPRPLIRKRIGNGRKLFIGKDYTNKYWVSPGPWGGWQAQTYVRKGNYLVPLTYRARTALRALRGCRKVVEGV